MEEIIVRTETSQKDPGTLNPDILDHSGILRETCHLHQGIKRQSSASHFLKCTSFCIIAIMNHGAACTFDWATQGGIKKPICSNCDAPLRGIEVICCASCENLHLFVILHHGA